MESPTFRQPSGSVCFMQLALLSPKDRLTSLHTVALCALLYKSYRSQMLHNEVYAKYAKVIECKLDLWNLEVKLNTPTLHKYL